MLQNGVGWSTSSSRGPGGAGVVDMEIPRGLPPRQPDGSSEVPPTAVAEAAAVDPTAVAEAAVAEAAVDPTAVAEPAVAEAAVDPGGNVGRGQDRQGGGRQVLGLRLQVLSGLCGGLALAGAGGGDDGGHHDDRAGCLQQL